MVSPTSGSGSGGSGSLGGPLVPTQRDIETTAWTEINKAALGIVKDSIDMSFSQIDQRYSKSHLGTQTGYRAKENQPLLDHTLENLRMLQGSKLPIESPWAPAYEQLLSKLPPGVLSRYLIEQEKPLAEQDPSFAATANVLKLTAQILTRISIHCETAAPDSLEAARTENNLINSLVAMKQSLINSTEATQKAEEFLNEQGANLPNHDEYLSTIKQIQGHADLLSKIDFANLPASKEERHL